MSSLALILKITNILPDKNIKRMEEIQAGFNRLYKYESYVVEAGISFFVVPPVTKEKGSFKNCLFLHPEFCKHIGIVRC
jgi:hypothetical protein